MLGENILHNDKITHIKKITASLYKLLNNNKRYYHILFSEWIAHNILCISEELGTFFFGYELETQNLFFDLQKKKEGRNSEPLLLLLGKKKQNENVPRELKRLHSSINYDGHSKSPRGSGDETKIIK